VSIVARDFRALRLDGVCRDFGGYNALRDINITVARGEFIALLGPSGCGKSTALNCLAGLMPLSAGSIWLDETRIDTLPAEKRGFGMVFQNYALFPHLTVARNVAFGLEMQKRPKEEIARRVADALALVRLTSQQDKLPGQLSGGQQQRVAIARAIVIEPPLVLMDEPLSNLDAKLRLEMRAEIRRIHATLGCATIYVTHDQDEALSLAGRIVVLREGQMRQVGTPRDLYERPSHPDVAEFMGYRNLLPSEIEAGSLGHVDVAVCGGTLAGTPVERLTGGRVLAAIRPEDLTAGAQGAFSARVTGAEYRGRYFFGEAKAADGTLLYFRAARRVVADEIVHLSAPVSRVLVYNA
jgi:putative spermidine/putrescine transport system ATP-binding protein